MNVNETLKIGSLILILLVSGVIYIQMNDLKMRIDLDKTTFYVYDGRWVISGVEYNRLFNGTKIMYRITSKISVEKEINGNNVMIRRMTPYKNGPVIVDEYYYSGDIKSKELFPIYHKVKIFNGTGYLYRYTVDSLSETGPKKKITDVYILSFGRNMKIKFEPGYRWAWIGYPYGSDSFSAQYSIKSDYEEFNMKLFDPTKFNVTLNEPADNSNINYTSNGIPINFTVEVDSSNITSCVLYGNFSGVWQANQSLGGIVANHFNDTNATNVNLSFTAKSNITKYIELSNETDVWYNEFGIKGYPGDTSVGDNETVPCWNFECSESWIYSETNSNFEGHIQTIAIDMYQLLKPSDPSCSMFFNYGDYNQINESINFSKVGKISFIYHFLTRNNYWRAEALIGNDVVWSKEGNTTTLWVGEVILDVTNKTEVQDLRFRLYTTTNAPSEPFCTTGDMYFRVGNISIYPYPANISIDIGADGDWDFVGNGTFTQQGMLTFDGAEINDWMATNCISENCSVPIIWHSDSPGKLNINNIAVYSKIKKYAITNFNPLVLPWGIYKWNVLCTNDLGETDWGDSNYTFTVGDVDTNFSIWNGTTWDNAYDYYIVFRCAPNQSYCEPEDQNISGNQSIYKICNNGTFASTSGVQLWINETCPGIDLLCNDKNSTIETLNITTTKKYINSSELAAGACIDVFCWANYSDPSHGCYFDIYSNVTR